MKPMLKYRGGKSKELGYLKKWVPLEYDRYIEPFSAVEPSILI